MNALLGFRAFRAEVQRLLKFSGANPLGFTDRVLIVAWLAGESPADLAHQLIDFIQSVECAGGAQ